MLLKLTQEQQQSLDTLFSCFRPSLNELNQRNMLENMTRSFQYVPCGLNAYSFFPVLLQKLYSPVSQNLFNKIENLKDAHITFFGETPACVNPNFSPLSLNAMRIIEAFKNTLHLCPTFCDVGILRVLMHNRAASSDFFETLHRHLANLLSRLTEEDPAKKFVATKCQIGLLRQLLPEVFHWSMQCFCKFQQLFDFDDRVMKAEDGLTFVIAEKRSTREISAEPDEVKQQTERKFLEAEAGLYECVQSLICCQELQGLVLKNFEYERFKAELSAEEKKFARNVLQPVNPLWVPAKIGLLQALAHRYRRLLELGQEVIVPAFAVRQPRVQLVDGKMVVDSSMVEATTASTQREDFIPSTLSIFDTAHLDRILEELQRSIFQICYVVSSILPPKAEELFPMALVISETIWTWLISDIQIFFLKESKSDRIVPDDHPAFDIFFRIEEFFKSTLDVVTLTILRKSTEADCSEIKSSMQTRKEQLYAGLPGLLSPLVCSFFDQQEGRLMERVEPVFREGKEDKISAVVDIMKQCILDAETKPHSEFTRRTLCSAVSRVMTRLLPDPSVSAGWVDAFFKKSEAIEHALERKTVLRTEQQLPWLVQLLSEIKLRLEVENHLPQVLLLALLPNPPATEEGKESLPVSFEPLNKVPNVSTLFNHSYALLAKLAKSYATAYYDPVQDAVWDEPYTSADSKKVDVRMMPVWQDLRLIWTMVNGKLSPEAVNDLFLYLLHEIYSVVEWNLCGVFAKKESVLSIAQLQRLEYILNTADSLFRTEFNLNKSVSVGDGKDTEKTKKNKKKEKEQTFAPKIKISSFPLITTQLNVKLEDPLPDLLSRSALVARMKTVAFLIKELRGSISVFIDMFDSFESKSRLHSAHCFWRVDIHKQALYNIIANRATLAKDLEAQGFINRAQVPKENVHQSALDILNAKVKGLYRVL
jgi:hypothetical protein